jgi:hypothetical protein
MSFGNPGAYPIPGASTGYGIGPEWLKFHEFQPDYQQVTNRHEYEDGGASFLIINDTAPILWTIEYDGLEVGSGVGVSIIDAHRADAFGEVYGFSLTNPRTSVTYTDVHYLPEFEEDHRKTWINRRVIRLIKRPV